MPMRDDVSVLIPLHGSAPFIEVVAGNIDRLAGHVRVVVSDATVLDGTLDELRERFAGRPGISWLGKRHIAPGWVAHCNEIAAITDSEFMMWLPHDDDIDLSYVHACLEALVDDPNLGAVVGVVASLRGPGLHNRSQTAFPAPSRIEEFRLPANALLADWNLGLLFRSLVRRSVWHPLPHTIGADEWADMVWGYGLALRTRVQQLETVTYGKRFHSASAHARWATEFYPRGFPYLMRELVNALPGDELGPAAVELTDVMTEWIADVVDERSKSAARWHRISRSLPYRTATWVRQWVRKRG